MLLCCDGTLGQGFRAGVSSWSGRPGQSEFPIAIETLSKLYPSMGLKDVDLAQDMRLTSRGDDLSVPTLDTYSVPALCSIFPAVKRLWPFSICIY